MKTFSLARRSVFWGSMVLAIGAVGCAPQSDTSAARSLAQEEAREEDRATSSDAIAPPDEVLSTSGEGEGALSSDRIELPPSVPLPYTPPDLRPYSPPFTPPTFRPYIPPIRPYIPPIRPYIPPIRPIR